MYLRGNKNFWQASPAFSYQNSSPNPLPLCKRCNWVTGIRKMPLPSREGTVTHFRCDQRLQPSPLPSSKNVPTSSFPQGPHGLYRGFWNTVWREVQYLCGIQRGASGACVCTYGKSIFSTMNVHFEILFSSFQIPFAILQYPLWEYFKVSCTEWLVTKNPFRCFVDSSVGSLTVNTVHCSLHMLSNAIGVMTCGYWSR